MGAKTGPEASEKDSVAAARSTSALFSGDDQTIRGGLVSSGPDVTTISNSAGRLVEMPLLAVKARWSVPTKPSGAKEMSVATSIAAWPRERAAARAARNTGTGRDPKPAARRAREKPDED
jgi:hypothetical protein